jgi:hypothetical protein
MASMGTLAKVAIAFVPAEIEGNFALAMSLSEMGIVSQT